MTKLAIAAVCVFLLALSGCGNTVRGMKQDGVQTSNALMTQRTGSRAPTRIDAPHVPSLAIGIPQELIPSSYGCSRVPGALSR